MIKRRKLGPVYEQSPAEKTGEWLIDNVMKIVSTCVIWLIWWGVYYVLTGIYRFLAINLMEWKEERSPYQMMKSPTSMMIIAVGMMIIAWYVLLRDPLKKKKIHRGDR